MRVRVRVLCARARTRAVWVWVCVRVCNSPVALHGHLHIGLHRHVVAVGECKLGLEGEVHRCERPPEVGDLLAYGSGQWHSLLNCLRYRALYRTDGDRDTLKGKPHLIRTLCI